MALYYFHLHECGTVIPDPEGTDLPSVDAARARAVREARQVMSSEIIEGRLCLGCFFLVADEAGNEAFRLDFRDAVTVKGI